MAEQPTAEEFKQWHRRFAAEANNLAWTLSEKPELSDEERTQLLNAAHAAAFHWSKVGSAGQIAHAELLLGRVHALLDNGELAMKFATSAFNALTAGNPAPWEAAFAHAILANAAASSGNAVMHAQNYEKAKALGDGLTDAEDKQLFEATFLLIPSPA
jgi:hypothetical protein